MRSRFLVWGAGAIGGTLGAHLALHGDDVTMVDTCLEHVTAIVNDGLHITGPIDDFVVRVPAFTPQTLGGTWDAIILATKAHHTDVAVRALGQHLTAGGCVVSAQNGLNELTIAEVVGAERPVGAFVNFGADYLEPGVVHYAGHGAVVVGEIDGRITPRVTAIPTRGNGSMRARSSPATSGATCGERRRTARCCSRRRSPTSQSPTRSRCPATATCTWPLPAKCSRSRWPAA